MIVENLVQRIYLIYGDDRDDPAELFESHVYDLLNDGLIDLRGHASDEWDRDQTVVVASQREYDFPDDAVRLIALFWDWWFIPPVTMLWLDSRDESWITREGEIICWTQDGLQWNRYALYKIPEVTSEFPINFTIDTVPAVADRVTSASYGIIVDADGDPDVVAVVDTVPAVGDRVSSEDFGIFVDGFETTNDPSYGIITSIDQPSRRLMDRWYVKRPDPLTNSFQEIPVPDGWALALVWYVLWKVYERAGEKHNSVLAGFYREQYMLDRESLRLRAERPTPRIIHKLAPAQGLPKGPIPYAQSMVDPVSGATVRLIW